MKSNGSKYKKVDFQIIAKINNIENRCRLQVDIEEFKQLEFEEEERIHSFEKLENELDQFNLSSKNLTKSSYQRHDFNNTPPFPIYQNSNSILSATSTSLYVFITISGIFLILLVCCSSLMCWLKCCCCCVQNKKKPTQFQRKQSIRHILARMSGRHNLNNADITSSSNSSMFNQITSINSSATSSLAPLKMNKKVFTAFFPSTTFPHTEVRSNNNNNSNIPNNKKKRINEQTCNRTISNSSSNSSQTTTIQCYSSSSVDVESNSNNNNNNNTISFLDSNYNKENKGKHLNILFNLIIILKKYSYFLTNR
jgi:hypothetical protein